MSDRTLPESSQDELPDLPALSELMAKLVALSGQFEKHLEQAIAIGVDKVQGEDHLVIAALRRALDNVHGMVAMVGQKNLFCGMPIVRFQIDTAMTLFGRHLVTDVDAYVKHMMTPGNERRKYRDRDGKRLTDQSLHQQLTYEHEFMSSRRNSTLTLPGSFTFRLSTCTGFWTSMNGSRPVS